MNKILINKKYIFLINYFLHFYIMTECQFNFGEYDIFAVPFNFKYQRMDKYSTGLSFTFSCFFLAFSFIFFCIHFALFTLRSNYDLKIYSLTDYWDYMHFGVFYMNSKLDFAYRLDCGKYNTNKSPENLLDLLDVNIKVNYINHNGYMPFNYSDYFDIFNSFNCKYNSDYGQFEKINTIEKSNYKCLNLSKLSQGKNYFVNYEMIISLKGDSKSNFSYVNDYLLNNDCKIELSFTDYDIIVDRYSDPFNRYQRSLFLKLNSYSISEMDIYFMNRKLIDNNIFIKYIKKTRENIVFSYYKEKFNYKGNYTSRLKLIETDRDYKTYAKIYIKPDIKTLSVIRQYQTIWEFIGYLSSILMAIYTLLDFIFGIYNRFNLYHSLTKKIFFFKDVKDEHLNYFPNDHKIINLINKMKGLNNNNDNNISFYENIIKTNIKNSMLLNQKESKEPKNTADGQDSNINFEIPKDIESNISQKKFKPRKIEFSYNIFEIFFHKCLCLCKCCISQNLELKRQITSKAEGILTDKLDIVLFIRNAMLLDLMKKILLGDDKESIIKFLIRPILSEKQNEINNNITEKQKIYENYCDTDFKNCEKEVDNLVGNKKEISEVDRKLIIYTKQQLIQLFGD